MPRRHRDTHCCKTELSVEWLKRLKSETPQPDSHYRRAQLSPTAGPWVGLWEGRCLTGSQDTSPNLKALLACRSKARGLCSFFCFALDVSSLLLHPGAVAWRRLASRFKRGSLKKPNCEVTPSVCEPGISKLRFEPLAAHCGPCCCIRIRGRSVGCYATLRTTA